jgi:nicotinate-nucleotide adenylyltransferase
MRIAILGGSFDPPHLGHHLLTTQIRIHFAIDQVWLMPCYTHPFLKQLSPAKHRLAMTTLIETELLKVSDLEVKKQDTSYSIDTLRLLKQTFPFYSFLWIIGSDQIRDFPKWKDWQAIVEQFGLIIYPRGTSIQMIPSAIRHYLHLQSIPRTIFYPKAPLQTSTISSTAIRQRIRNKQPITDLVTPEVAAYIMKRKLYE